MPNPMKYGDLIQFEPIESVIQLLDANRPGEQGGLDRFPSVAYDARSLEDP